MKLDNIASQCKKKRWVQADQRAPASPPRKACWIFVSEMWNALRQAPSQGQAGVPKILRCVLGHFHRPTWQKSCETVSTGQSWWGTGSKRCTKNDMTHIPCNGQLSRWQLKVGYQTGQEWVFKNGTNHGDNLTRWRAIPVGTNLHKKIAKKEAHLWRDTRNDIAGDVPPKLGCQERSNTLTVHNHNCSTHMCHSCHTCIVKSKCLHQMWVCIDVKSTAILKGKMCWWFSTLGGWGRTLWEPVFGHQSRCQNDNSGHGPEKETGMKASGFGLDLEFCKCRHHCQCAHPHLSWSMTTVDHPLSFQFSCWVCIWSCLHDRKLCNHKNPNWIPFWQKRWARNHKNCAALFFPQSWCSSAHNHHFQLSSESLFTSTGIFLLWKSEKQAQTCLWNTVCNTLDTLF